MTHAWTRRRDWAARFGAVGIAISMLIGGGSAASSAAVMMPAGEQNVRMDGMYPVTPPMTPAAVQAQRAARAIAAARSQIGVPYVYMSSRPGVGFDCSGLAMYAWGRAGVRLPHSSADQYATVRPRISRAGLRPGDLLFFFWPVHHVAIYLGHGLMIHAPHTGVRVTIEPVSWQYFVGAARPGL